MREQAEVLPGPERSTGQRASDDPPRAGHVERSVDPEPGPLDPGLRLGGLGRAGLVGGVGRLGHVGEGVAQPYDRRTVVGRSRDDRRTGEERADHTISDLSHHRLVAAVGRHVDVVSAITPPRAP